MFARVIGAITSVLALAFVVLLLAPGSSATPAARAQDDPTTATTEDGSVVTLLPSTTSTAEVITSTTASEETSSTTEAPTSTTGVSAGAASSTTVDRNAPGGANLLIPGDGTAGAEMTTPTVRGRRISDSGPSDGTLIALVMAGLVIIAGAISVLTWRYWAATRPPLLDADRTSTTAE